MYYQVAIINQAALGSDAETRSSRRVHKDVGYMIVFFRYGCSENLFGRYEIKNVS